MADRTKVYFISDLHLGAGYRDSREAERRVVRFLHSIADDAAALYLMGDILDYWFEYRTVVPRGYVRFFGALASLADSGVRIVWYIGNHDIWLFDYLRDEIGIEVVDGYRVEDINGARFFLNHGDGVGRLDPGFRFIRAVFRNRLCQKLYAGIHPRWTIPFALRWSSHSRKSGENTAVREWHGEDEALEKFAIGYLRDTDPTVNFFVFGHLHIMVDQRIGPHSRIIVLGDWISHFSYGVWDGTDFVLRRAKL